MGKILYNVNVSFKDASNGKRLNTKLRLRNFTKSNRSYNVSTSMYSDNVVGLFDHKGIRQYGYDETQDYICFGYHS